MTILVTGATGFLGGRVVERLVLEEKARVRVLVRAMGRAARIASLPVEYHLGDVTDEAAFTKAAQDCDVVIHCASSMEGGVAPEMTSTCRGARTAALACATTGAKLVHISSCAVYGIPSAQEVNESSPQRPRSKNDRYALAKIAAERYVRATAGEKNLRAAILQPTLIYGPHSEEWTLSVLSMLRASDLGFPAVDNSACNAVYVDDVVTAALLAIQKCDSTCPSYLINGGEIPTWTEYLNRHVRLGTRGHVVPLTTEEITRLKSESNQSRSLPGTLMRLLREKPEVRSAIMGTSLIGGGFSLMEKCVSKSTFDKVKKRLRAGAAQSAPVISFPQPDKLPLRLPPPHFIDLAAQTHRYSNAEASAHLGYKPAYSLDRAFDAIASWARWSRLVG